MSIRNHSDLRRDSLPSRTGYAQPRHASYGGATASTRLQAGDSVGRPSSVSSSGKDASKSRRGRRKQCTLWVHEESSLKEDVIINKHIFSEGEVEVGDLVEVIAVEVGVSAVEPQEIIPERKGDTSGHRKSVEASGLESSAKKMKRQSANPEGAYHGEEERKRHGLAAPLSRRYLFLVHERSTDHKTKRSNLQVCLYYGLPLLRLPGDDDSLLDRG